MISNIYTDEFILKCLKKDSFIAFFLSYAHLSSDWLRKSVDILDTKYNTINYCVIDISYAYEFGHIIPFEVQYTPQILFFPPRNPPKKILGNLPVDYIIEIMKDEGFLPDVTKHRITFEIITEP